MIHEQRWIPDTCANPAANDACSVIETWDDAVPDVARVHTFLRVEKTCSVHTGLSGQVLYDALYEQNRRKNVALRIAQSIKQTISYESYHWSFDTDRVLVADFGTNLNSQQKSQAQDAADIQFGQGKVIIR